MNKLKKLLLLFSSETVSKTPITLQYGCETWARVCKAEIFGSKRAVSNEWRILHNKELHDLLISPGILCEYN
jgi:hypothetical protein